MARIQLGQMGRDCQISGGLTLYQLAWMNAAADIRATEILYALNTKLGRMIEKDGIIQNPHPFSYRLRPVEQQLAKPDLPENLRTIFACAAELHDELAQRPHVYGHGHPHHFNFARDADNRWTALNVDGLHAPAAYQLATACINPSWPARFPNAQDITLNRERFMHQVGAISRLTDETCDAVARAAFLHIAHTAARRVDGTPEGQAPLNHFLALGKMASEFIGRRLDPDVFTPHP